MGPIVQEAGKMNPGSVLPGKPFFIFSYCPGSRITSFGLFPRLMNRAQAQPRMDKRTLPPGEYSQPIIREKKRLADKIPERYTSREEHSFSYLNAGHYW